MALICMLVSLLLHLYCIVSVDIDIVLCIEQLNNIIVLHLSNTKHRFLT